MSTNRPQPDRPDFSKRLAALPLEPGVYVMKNTAGTVLYVGKAMALRNRVRSYFQNPRKLDPKTREMVAQIADFEFIRTNTVAEALILENELVKRHWPKYNIRLKDDSSYPYLKITNEEWPRVISTRNIVKDGGRYFGPYTSAGKAYETLNLLNRLFPYRKCEQKITGHEQVCLYYHMKQCTAPCIGAVDNATYMNLIEATALFLNGRGDEILAPLEEEMQQASDGWNFERAAELRDRIRAVKHVLERQNVVNVRGETIDVIAVAQGAGGDAGVQASFIRNGKTLGSEFFPMQATIADTPGAIVSTFLSQFYAEAAMVPGTILIQHALPEEDRELVALWLTERRGGKVELIVPQRGERRQLIAMAAKSAHDNLEQARIKHLSDEQKVIAALSELAEALELPRMPRRIECFDISNIQGTNPVASMVVCIDGRPAKKEYRKFAIKTVEGPNDFASMAEVITRRFRRAKEAEADDVKWADLPDLVIVDGGKGQLNAALGALAAIDMQVSICGLAKENEELFLPGRSESILLERDSQALFLVQRIRDEAHRFAVTFHRAKRSKSAFQSGLDVIPGVGPTRKKALIKAFGSVKGVREATIEQLVAVDGINQKLAEQIKAGL
ncbi:MAG TPA: excinuclease ABC subunit UvrC [Thermomicrobiales bacterium]|nr:excinuclease ABC subunit UvrC [Thermomicrobiales bacterium]